MMPFGTVVMTTLRYLALFSLALAVQVGIIVLVNPLPWQGQEAALMLSCAVAGTGIPLLLARILTGSAVRHAPHYAVEPSGKAHLALALGVSHEIRQPLFAIQLMTRNAQMYADDEVTPAGEALRAALSRIATQTDKAIAIMNRMLDLARNQPQASERTDLVSAIQRSLANWRVTTPDQTIEATLNLADYPTGKIYTNIDPVGFEQVIINALDNAAESIAQRRQTGWQEQGLIEIILACSPGQIHCRITDNGAGLDSRTEQRAFEPFYSTKSGKVGGFGLFLSREILERAGGTVQLLPATGGGAILAIVLPTD